jgi:phenylacetate-CoA ligase
MLMPHILAALAAFPAMLEWLLRHAIHPSANLVTGHLSEIAELKRLQWQTRNEINSLILKRMRFIVSHSYERFRFCRDRLDSVGLRPDDIRTLEDFRRIPTITRGSMSKCIDDEAILTRGLGTLTSTGGTSGRPLIFPVSRNASIAGLASEIFFENWIGVEAHERKFSSRPYVRIKDRLFLNELQATSASIVMSPERVYRKLRGFRPKLVSGNAALRILASHMAQNDLRMTEEPRGVFAWGIPLLPEQVELMSKAFCENIYDAYGSAELGGTVAQECEARTGLHVNTELSMVEVLKDGEPCSEGERGRLVVTNLRNQATPFIRYEQGDSAVVLEDCACGRHMPLIAHIRGKDPSSIQIKDGMRIPRATLNSIVGHMEESQYIERFSFRKDSADGLVLTVQPKPGFDPQIAERIRHHLTRVLGVSAEISVGIADSLENGSVKV